MTPKAKNYKSLDKTAKSSKQYDSDDDEVSGDYCCPVLACLTIFCKGNNKKVKVAPPTKNPDPKAGGAKFGIL